MNLKSITNVTKSGAHPVIAGLTYSFSIAIIMALFFTILLYLTSFSDSSLQTASYIVTAISLLTGGFVSGKKAGNKGWYFGGITGVIYGVILALITFLGFDADINLKGLVLIILTFLFGALGGVFGVNSKK